MICEATSNLRSGWREAAGPDDAIDVDLFAGGGGVAMGFEAATGKAFDVAVNHDADAIAMHAANHPGTKHLCCDVFEVDPVEACRDERVGGGRPGRAPSQLTWWVQWERALEGAVLVEGIA